MLLGVNINHTSRNRKEPLHAMKFTPQSSFTRKLFPILVGASALVFAVLQVGATIGTSLQMQLGNPSSATANATNHHHYLIQRTVEAIDYSDTNGCPNWASWDLTSSDVGSSGRGDFHTDTNLPSGFYEVTTGDYTGSGYDRGHMCPSADRTDNQTDNSLVFYMSNIIPQTADNNEGPWESFESYCRTLAAAGDELLITCGPSTFTGSRIKSGKVAIPGYTWKIVVVVPKGSGTALSRITSTNRVIAVKMPNIAGIKSVNWTNYITSANQIQTDTGYTFFSALSSSVAAKLRAKVDGQSASASSASSVSPASDEVEESVKVDGQSAVASDSSSVSTASTTPLASGQTRTLRIVEYNIDCDTGTITPLPGLIAPSSGNVTNGGVLEGIGEEIINGDPAQPIDVLALNETTSNTSTVQPIVNALNAFYAYHTNPAGYAMSTYQATESGGSPSTGNGPNAMVYNTNTLQLIASVPVDPPGGTSQLGSSSGMYREAMRYEFAPAGVTAGTNNEFYVYVSHYKASSGSQNDQYRLGEAKIIRNNESTNCPANARVLYVGDYNPDDNSVEPGYQTICSNSAPDGVKQGQGVDPLNILWGTYTSAATNINWGSSTTSTSILFMLSDASTAIKYRDDLQIMTSNVYYDVAGGLQYVQRSYHSFGNNGSFTYGSSVAASGNTALNDLDPTLTNLYKLSASTLLADLTTASDHLPTVADYTIPIGSSGSTPSITSFSPTSGAVGTNVVITGSAFTGATAVKFNGTAATSFTVNSDTQITATVSTGATSGTISVTTANGTGTSSTSFTVTSSSGGTLNISQVYGGGGNSGATYKNDFIELYNASSATIDLSTYAVQYASASGSSWSETTLSGTIQSGHYYLIQEAAGSGGTSNLPTAEATGTINMSATAGKVALTKTQTLLTVDNPVSNTNVVDFVGYGSADAYEGSGAAPAPSSTTSDLRAGNGATNTYNNASDFSTGTPNPRN